MSPDKGYQKRPTEHEYAYANWTPTAQFLHMTSGAPRRLEVPIVLSSCWLVLYTTMVVHFKALSSDLSTERFLIQNGQLIALIGFRKTVAFLNYTTH